MRGFSVPLFECGGDPELLPELFAQGCPQLADSGVGLLARGLGLIVPGEFGHQPGGFIRLQIDPIVTGDTFAFLLEPPDPLVDRVAFPFAAHDEIVIYVQGEPFEVFLAGNPRVHDDQGAFRGMELFEHFLQGAAFADVAIEDLRVPDKPAGIKGETGGKKGAAASFLLGPASFCLGIPLGITFHVGVGQVVKGNGGGEAEGIPHALKNLLSDQFFTLKKPVRGTLKLHQWHGGGAMVEKLTGGAFFLQPPGGRTLAAGGAHSADDVAERLGLLPSAEARPFEDLRDLEFLQGFQGNVFGTHGSGFGLLEGIGINFLEISGITGCVSVVQFLDFAPAGDDSGV